MIGLHRGVFRDLAEAPCATPSRSTGSFLEALRAPGNRRQPKPPGISSSRRVHLAGCTAHPDADWVTQQARQVTWTLSERSQPVRFLIRDHDCKFTDSFDAVFEGQGARIVRTPIQVPEANGIAERFVRTVRSECLDWLLIVSAQHLERALTVYLHHYNVHRGHRSLELAPPNGRPAIEPWSCAQPMDVKRRDRLGGLIHEYRRAA